MTGPSQTSCVGFKMPWEVCPPEGGFKIHSYDMHLRHEQSKQRPTHNLTYTAQATEYTQDASNIKN